jgi:hypothetical protein
MRAAQPFAVPFETFVKCLRRNFNGVEVSKFRRVMTAFINSCHVTVPPLLIPADQRVRMTQKEIEFLEERRYLAPRPLDTLREALGDVQSSAEMNNRCLLMNPASLSTSCVHCIGLPLQVSSCRPGSPRPSLAIGPLLHPAPPICALDRNSPFRHVMVISDTLAGLDILLEELRRTAQGRTPEMVYVSSFQGDKTDFRRTELESQLKAAIEMGRTVVLVNAASMYSALYDVLVSHGSLDPLWRCLLCHIRWEVGRRGRGRVAGEPLVYRVVASPAASCMQNKHHTCIRERAAEGTERVKSFYGTFGYQCQEVRGYGTMSRDFRVAAVCATVVVCGVCDAANIGMGAFSRPCKVDPASRIVVYAPVSQVDAMPLPFMARFEKYCVTVDGRCHGPGSCACTEGCVWGGAAAASWASWQCHHVPPLTLLLPPRPPCQTQTF